MIATAKEEPGENQGKPTIEPHRRSTVNGQRARGGTTPRHRPVEPPNHLSSLTGAAKLSILNVLLLPLFLDKVDSIMSPLFEAIAQYLSPDRVETLSHQIGATPDQTRQAIGATLPSMLEGLARNTETPAGQQQLDSALARHHDGSLLDHLGSLFGGQAASVPVPDKATAGGSILDHILGRRKEPMAGAVAKGSGLDSGQVMKLMMLLAPVVLAYLGRQRKEQNLSPEQMGATLQQERSSVHTASGGLLGRFFDQDGDGDFDMMDIMRLGASKLIGR